MVQCFAPDCNHRTEHVSCKMFMMPADPQIQKRWRKLLACRTDRIPTRTTYVCSCHFKDGLKSNGPTIFKHNKEKLMSYSSPEKRTRKRQTPKISETITSASTSSMASPPQQKSFLHDITTELSSPRSHTSNNTVEELNLEVELLRSKVWNLESQLKSVHDKNKFSYKNISSNDELIRLYTGLSDNATFQALLNYVTTFQINFYASWRVTRISVEDQLLITLMKLRLNFPHLDLATRFACSSSTISNIFLTWIHVLHKTVYLRFMGKIPSPTKIKTCLPNSFSTYINCRVIIDCTEIKIAIPTNMKIQRETYSSYKHANTYKALVGVAPNAVLVSVSNLYPGSISDKQIFIESNICSQLIPGDMIIVDKGFLIADVVPAGVSVNIPPFLINRQFTRQEAVNTLNIARCRIHVERANARIKSYRILNLIPATLKPFASIVFQVCCALVNLQNPLLKEIEIYLDPED